MTPFLRAGLLLPFLVLLASGAPAADTPAAGRYDGELCVATSGGQPRCGAAEIDLRGSGALRVRISDIVYQLQLHSSQVDVVLMHGAMQIDEFTADYTWAGRALQFADKEREARYELRLAARQIRK